MVSDHGDQLGSSCGDQGGRCADVDLGLGLTCPLCPLWIDVSDVDVKTGESCFEKKGL